MKWTAAFVAIVLLSACAPDYRWQTPPDMTKRDAARNWATCHSAVSSELAAAEEEGGFMGAALADQSVESYDNCMRAMGFIQVPAR